MRLRFATAALLIACVSGVAVRDARASEPNVVGMGARSPGMGGTGAADTTGFESAYVNPAGLVVLGKRVFNVGYVLGNFDLTLDKRDYKIEAPTGLLLGANVPLPLGGVLRDRLAIGLGFYLPSNVIAKAHAPFPDEPRIATLETHVATVSITVALAAKLHRRVQVGIGILALAALVGEITLQANAGGNISTLAEQQLVTGFAPTMGLQVQATRWLRLGGSLIGESKATYDIRVISKLSGQLPIDLPPLRFKGVAQYDPLKFTIEASFTPLRWIKVNAGFTYKDWSRFPRPIENATAGAAPLPNPDYHDTVVPRVGLELTAFTKYLRIDGRVGYFYEWSPAPTGPDRVLLDADRHAITLGLGLELQKWVGLKLDLFGQFHQTAGSPRVGGLFGFFGFAVGVDL